MSITLEVLANQQLLRELEPPERPKRLTNAQKNANRNDDFMAAAVGDARWLQQSMKKHRDVTIRDKNGLCPIHIAAVHGRLECIKVLVEDFGCDVNLPSQTGWRATHLCISNQTGRRSHQCLVYLLEKGADPSVANNDGTTPMHMVAAEGHVHCMETLLKHNAKLDGVDVRGMMPIDLAKLWGHRKCAKVMAHRMWQLDKSFTPTEAKQLELYKLQQVLLEIEREEGDTLLKDTKHKDNFQHWLKDHGMNDAGRTDFDKPPEHRLKTAEKAQQAGTANPQRLTVPQQAPVHAPKPQPPPPPPPPKESRQRPRSAVTMHSYGLHDTASLAESKQSRRHQPSESSGLHWKYSTHVQPSKYVKNLEDVFPRDPFTMLPKEPPKPHVYEAAKSLDPKEKKKLLGKSIEPPRLPTDIANREFPVPDVFRPGVFKCKNVVDLAGRKKCPELTPKSEVSMHLINDTESHLFKASTVQRPPQLAQASAPSSGKRSLDQLDLVSVLAMLKSMSQQPVNG